MGETRAHATMFGGSPLFDRNVSDNDHPKLADTTVLEFESVQSGDTPSSRQWELVGVADSSQLGTPERETELEKMKEKRTEHELQVPPPAPSILTPWMTPSLPIQQPTLLPTLFPGQQLSTLPVQQPATIQIHQPSLQPNTTPIFQPYFPSYNAGIQDTHPEYLRFIPPIQPSPHYPDDHSVVTLTDPHPPATLPWPQSEMSPAMSSTTSHLVPPAAPFPQLTSDTASLAAVHTTVSAILPQSVSTHYSYAPLQEPSSSGQESKPRDPEIKHDPESPSKKDLLSQPKVEPLSPKNEAVKPTLELSSKQDVKPKKVGLFHYTEQGDELLRNDIALLQELITEQRKEIKYLKALIHATPLQGAYTHGEVPFPTGIKDEPSSVKIEPNLPPAWEQGDQTYPQMTHDVRSTEYLRGFESFAETSFVITGSHSHTFEWEGYGLKLHIPEGAMPEEHKGCRIDIKTCLSGQFSFPNGSQLVSCVYWLSCSQQFLKSVTLEIEHCAAVQHSSQSSSLCFVVAKCSQAELPYQFKELKQGTFSLQSSYGSIQLSQFSIFGIVCKMFSFYGNKEPRCYCSNLYYIKEGLNDWQVDFVIMWNLSGYREAVKKVYAGYASDSHLSLAVVFQEDTIKLTVPVDGEVLENGWEITPLTPPTITKRQVDSFRPGQQVPSCCLSIEWAKDGNPIKLKHRISLVGAMEPFNFFYIKCIPENPPVEIEGLREYSQKRRREQEEDHHNDNLKKVKLSSVPEIQEEITTQMAEQEETNILAAGTLTSNPVATEVPLPTSGSTVPSHKDGGTESTTTKPRLKDLMDALYHKVADKWKMIGVLIEIPKGTLAAIAERCQHDPHRCLIEMLEVWLERVHPPASWTTMIEAVEFLGEEQLGRKLTDRYIP